MENLVLARLPRNLLNWLGWQMTKDKTRITGPDIQNGMKARVIRQACELSPLTLRDLSCDHSYFYVTQT